MTINHCNKRNPHGPQSCSKPEKHLPPHGDGHGTFWDDGREIVTGEERRVVFVYDDAIAHLTAARDLLSMAKHNDLTQDLTNRITGLQAKRNSILGRQHDQSHGRLA